MSALRECSVGRLNEILNEANGSAIPVDCGGKLYEIRHLGNGCQEMGFKHEKCWESCCGHCLAMLQAHGVQNEARTYARDVVTCLDTSVVDTRQPAEEKV
jgi:hypothetical protein